MSFCAGAACLFNASIVPSTIFRFMEAYCHTNGCLVYLVSTASCVNDARGRPQSQRGQAWLLKGWPERMWCAWLHPAAAWQSPFCALLAWLVMVCKILGSHRLFYMMSFTVETFSGTSHTYIHAQSTA